MGPALDAALVRVVPHVVVEVVAPRPRDARLTIDLDELWERVAEAERANRRRNPARRRRS